jgi:putative FmdB family regulatory protein
MPLYEYECEACGTRFEKIQKFSDPPADVCVKCGKGPVHKLPSSPAIQFKGSGWYVTDYAKKDTKGSKDSKDAKDTKDTKDAKDTKESKDSQDTASKTESSKTESTTKNE